MRARRAIDAALIGRDRELRERAAYVVSELVTNAFQHGTGRVHLTVYLGSEALRVEVGDDSPQPPVRRQPTPEDERGRGLLLVEAFGSAYGVAQRPPGKVVWVELALHEGRPPIEPPT